MSLPPSSNYTPFEVFIYPFIRDSDVILCATAGYFLVQFATLFVMPRISPGFRKLKPDDQRSFAIRVVAIANGLVMLNSAFIFVNELRQNDWKIHSNHYVEIPGYRPYRLAIVGYFLWDIIVCIAYKWGVMWTVHAIASFLGCYFLAFPYCDQYATYYSGMFESSNAFIHTAACLKMLHVSPSLATILEYMFALMFFFIRVVGGTIVTSRYFLDMVPLLVSGKGHSSSAISICLALVAVVMVLQYVWFWEIIKMATGKGDHKAPAEAAVAEGIATTSHEVNSPTTLSTSSPRTASPTNASGVSRRTAARREE